MQDITTTQILIIIFGGGGIIAGVIAILTFIFVRLDKRRERIEKEEAEKLAKEKEEKERQERLARLEAGEDDRIQKEFWKMFQEKKDEIERLNLVIDDMQANNSLARPTISRLYHASRKIRRQVILIENALAKLDAPDFLKTELEILSGFIDEFEACLP